MGGLGCADVMGGFGCADVMGGLGCADVMVAWGVLVMRKGPRVWCPRGCCLCVALPGEGRKRDPLSALP